MNLYVSLPYGLPRSVAGIVFLIYLRNMNSRDITFNINNITQGRPPLWSSDQSSWLQIQRSGFDFRYYQILSEVVGLERGPLSLVSTTEELLGRESRGYGRRDPLR
jgi:hypothetical protein